MIGCNIPRPWKRPPTPPISDQPYGSKTNEAVLKAFDQFHEAAHDLTYDKPRKEHVTNCPNCCAVITGPICEYCGTRFQTLADKTIDEIVIPIYVGGDRIDEVVTRNRAQFRSGGVHNEKN